MTISAMELFGSDREARFPSCTQVTLCHGICDSKCISCPIGRVNHGDATPAVREELRERLFMPVHVFQRVADEVARHPHAWLRMHARGEPLLHPHFADMVSYAKQRGIAIVQTFTDAISLSEAKACAILAAGLDVLECSVHGHTRTYEQLMRNGKHGLVIENIRRFRRLRDQTSARTKLVVSAVDQPEFQREKTEHREFWSPIADEVIYRPYHSWGDRLDDYCAALPERRHPCSQLWMRCTVGPTGNILACFNSWSEAPGEVLGNVLEDSIESVWSGAHYGRIRQGHVEGKHELACCSNCKDWGGSAWGEDSYEGLLRLRLSLAGEPAR